MYLKKRKFVQIIIIVLFSIIVIAGGFFTYKKFFAKADMIDDYAYGICKDQIKTIPQIESSFIPDRLYSMYPNAGYYQTTDTENGYSLDFDTYATSWKNAPGGEATRLKYKNLAPTVINEITQVMGEPFEKKKVTVVYDGYFKNPNFNDSLNEFQMISASSQYRYDLDMIIFNLAENEVDTFVHEIVHSFDNHLVLIEAYEEGIAEGISAVVSKKIDPNISVNFSNTNTARSILFSPMGLFRTISNEDLIIDRYKASGKLFYDLLQTDVNIIKNFRNNIRAGQEYSLIKKDSSSYMQRLILKTACAALTNQPNNYLNNYSEELITQLALSQADALKYNPEMYKNYIHAKQYVEWYAQSGGNAPAEYMKQMEIYSTGFYFIGTLRNKFMTENPLMDPIIKNDRKLYTDINYDKKSEKIGITSTYKRTKLEDIILALFVESYGYLPAQLKFADLESFLTKLEINNLIDFEQLLEVPAKKVEIKITLKDSAKTLVHSETQEWSYGGLSEGLFAEYFAEDMNEFLVLAGKSQYSGDIEISVNSYIKTFTATTRDSCVIACYPNGINSNTIELQDSATLTLKVINGWIEGSARQLVVNPTFDDGANGWTLSANYPTSTTTRDAITLAVNSDKCFDDEKCIKLRNNSANMVYARQKIGALEAGKKYTLTAHFSIYNGTPESKSYVKLYDATANKHYYSKDFGNSLWSRSTVELTPTTENAGHDWFVFLYSNDASPGYILYDSVRLNKE